MTQELSIEADPREDFGKNAARRLRHSGRVPAVVYGGGGPSIPVAVVPKKKLEILHSDAGPNAIFFLGMKGKTSARVFVRGSENDPSTGRVLRMALVRSINAAKLG